MNRSDVIALAVRAGLRSEHGVSGFAYLDRLEMFASLVEQHLASLPAAEDAQDKDRLDWLLAHPDATVCSGGAYGPYHVWFRYSNRTTEQFKTAREAIDAAMSQDSKPMTDIPWGGIAMSQDSKGEV